MGEGMGDDKGSFGSADDFLRNVHRSFVYLPTENCVTLRESTAPFNCEDRGSRTITANQDASAV